MSDVNILPAHGERVETALDVVMQRQYLPFRIAICASTILYLLSGLVVAWQALSWPHEAYVSCALFLLFAFVFHLFSFDGYKDSLTSGTGHCLVGNAIVLWVVDMPPLVYLIAAFPIVPLACVFVYSVVVYQLPQIKHLQTLKLARRVAQ